MNQYEDVPLFDQPDPPVHELSRMYEVPAYRASSLEVAEYTPIRVTNPVACDECFARQHETAGTSGPRHNAKVRRSFRGGPRLDLCRGHEELWHARDEADANGRKPKRTVS